MGSFMSVDAGILEVLSIKQRESEQWLSVWRLHLGSCSAGSWCAPGWLRSLCTPCRWIEQQIWPQSLQCRCSQSPQTHSLYRSSPPCYQRCCRNYVQRSNRGFRGKGAMHRQASHLTCTLDKEQWMAECCSACHERSDDGRIYSSNWIIPGDSFTWKSDATFSFGQIQNGEIEMFPGRNKQVWELKKKRNRRQNISNIFHISKPLAATLLSFPKINRTK